MTQLLLSLHTRAHIALTGNLRHDPSCDMKLAPASKHARYTRANHARGCEQRRNSAAQTTRRRPTVREGPVRQPQRPPEGCSLGSPRTDRRRPDAAIARVLECGAKYEG